MGGEKNITEITHIPNVIRFSVKEVNINLPFIFFMFLIYFSLIMKEMNMNLPPLNHHQSTFFVLPWYAFFDLIWLCYQSIDVKSLTHEREREREREREMLTCHIWVQVSHWIQRVDSEKHISMLTYIPNPLRILM